MFKVYWTNHGYCAAETFSSLQEAVDYAKSKCFEATIYNGAKEAWKATETAVASWSPIGGLRSY